MPGFWPQESLWPGSEDAGVCPKQALLLWCSAFLSSLHWKAERGHRLLQLSRLSPRDQRNLNTLDFWFGCVVSALHFSMTSWIFTKCWHKTSLYRWTWFSNSWDMSTLNVEESTLTARNYFNYMLFNSPWVRQKTVHCFVPYSVTFFSDKEQRQPLALSVGMAFICFKKKKLQSKEDHCSIEQIALWWPIFSFILVGVLWLPVFQLMLLACNSIDFPNLSELNCPENFH